MLVNSSRICDMGTYLLEPQFLVDIHCNVNIVNLVWSNM